MIHHQHQLIIHIRANYYPIYFKIQTYSNIFKHIQTYSINYLLQIQYQHMYKSLQRFATQKSFGKPTYIVAVKRTPIGAFLGKLSKFKAPELAAFAIKGAINSIKLDVNQINEVILGNVVSAGIGQAPARQASIKSGIPVTVPCTTINKVCSSGMKSVIYGSQSIGLGQSDVVVAGGFQSMSNAPFYINNHRKGFNFGQDTILDALAHDGLTDAFNNITMGLCAEKTATDFNMSRQVQDSFAVTSYQRTIDATKNGRFSDEIVPIKISDNETVTEDEEYKRFNKDKLLTLRTAFSKTGTITAGNASKINDGACALVLMSEQKVNQLGVSPIGRIISYADAEIEPIDFCIAPNYASKKALQYGGLALSAIDYFEFNEAFSVTVLANLKLMDIPLEKVNVNGGAVSLGHPIGMSGARIIQSLLSVLHQKKGRYGLAAICNGGGGSSAIVVQNLRK